MNKMMLAITLLMSALSYAQSGTRVFRITEGTFHPQHLTGAFIHGQVQVDYDAKKIVLEITRPMPRCPEGHACIQVMPEPLLVELPIVSVEKDACQVVKVTASQDMRPVDGLYEQIIVNDATNMHCRILTSHVQKAIYNTSFINRFTGEQVNASSKMTLQLESQENSVSRFQMAEGRLENFDPQEIPVFGELALSKDEVELNVTLKLNCEPGKVCRAYMPMPILAKLPVVKRESGFCGDTIIARKSFPNEGGVHVVEIKVIDYRRATCEIYMKNLVHVEYMEAHTSIGIQDLPVVRKGFFAFDEIK